MEQQQKTYNFGFHGIDIIDKATYRVPVNQGEIFSFELKCQAFVDSEKQLIVIFVEVGIKTTSTDQLVAKMMCGFGYYFENFHNEFEKGTDGDYILPLEIETVLRNISISTMRGIMYSELRGTQLHSAFLPVVVPSSFAPFRGNLINPDFNSNIKTNKQD